MVTGPLLHSMKWELLMGRPDAVIAEHARTDTTETAPRTFSALAMGAQTVWGRRFAFKDGMEEFGAPAEPFSCEIILRLFDEFNKSTSHVPLIGFEFTFLVDGISIDGIGGESIITEESVLRNLDGVDCKGERIGEASFLFILIPLDVFVSVYEALMLALAAFLLKHLPMNLLDRGMRIRIRKSSENHRMTSNETCE